MNLEIKPLTPELAEVFASYLGHLDFSHEPFWGSCFCRYYYTDCAFEDWIRRSGEENRDEAKAEIRAGRMHGYMAFEGERCVGWCNAAPAELLPRIRGELAPFCEGRKAACTICFVVHPDDRGKGVARALLGAAIQGFREKGYDGMVAFPFEDAQKPQKRYRGTTNMYLAAGYRQIGQTESTPVLWLDLQG